MLKGILRVLDNTQMDRIHQGALRILQETGLLIRGPFLLQALADAGCRVDHAAQRAWFPPDLVEKQIAPQRGRYQMVRSSLWYPFCPQLPAGDVAFAPQLTCDYGFTTPSVYDLDTGLSRPATSKDQLNFIRLGNAIPEVRAICAPVICSDCDPRIEATEAARTLLLNTPKPGWVSANRAAEIKHLAAFSALAAGHDPRRLRAQPPIFAHAYCTTSPLKIDTRSCEVLHEALKYGFPINFAPMPILGGTCPVTPAGAVVIATAEILGCLTAATLLAPDVFYYATAITGEMDMRTTQVCYATPAAILADAALHQLFRWRYGLVLNVEPAYVEAKAPGVQAAFMKAYRQMAFASTASSSLPLGLLDNGSTFSPAQAMIDLDTSRALHKLSAGIEVNDETLCLDLIHQMGFCEGTSYLECDHTVANFRDVQWDTRLFDRTYRGAQPLLVGAEDENLLRRADAQWRELVKAQPPFEPDPRFAAEVNRIADAARADLLAAP
ncbi:MAG TPA: trimethylamine methyltransferase family protein [Candidatus Brocadiia bacterium]|nr:trimethylamine methyltransferase family protein [Candidatus Brocadiia bacterium]